MESNWYRVLFSFVILMFIVLGAYYFFQTETWYTWWYRFDKLVVQPFVEENGLIELPESNYTLDYSKRIGLGVYIPQVNTYNYDLIVQHEDKIQHKLKYILLFRGWGDVDSDFPEYGVKYMKALELTPIITWEPWKRDFENPTVNQDEYSLQSIIAGEHDTYIKEWAESARDANIEIIIRFAQEQSTPPNSQSWYPWQGDPEGYIAAFHHIVDIFRENKADNVKFMWSPIYTEFTFSEAYFPGSEYVDYLGITSLNHGKEIGTEWERWKSCDEVFTPQYNAGLKYDLPIIVSEIGCSEIGGSKGDWYVECLDRISNSQNVIGLITVEIEDDPSYPGIDWRTDSSSKSLQGFIKAINNGDYQ